jgi:hypothetical protein
VFVCLVMLGDRCGMADSDENRGRSRRLVQRTGDGQAQVRYLMAR